MDVRSQFTTLLHAPRALWLASSALCICALQSFAFHDVRGDDAYITYRYGQNLAAGVGFVFNPGEHIQGFTSPGHALLSALVYAVFGRAATPGVMAVLGCVAWSAEALALFALLERQLGRAVAGFCALLIALGAAAGASWIVLETHFVAASVLFALYSALRERWYLAAASCAVGVLFRPDAALAAALILGSCLWQQRGRALGPIGTFLAIALPWPLFASAYYGSPLPQTALTKFHRVLPLRYLMHELGYPSQRLLWREADIAFAWLVLALAVFGARRLMRRGLWLLPAYGALHAAAYLVIRPFVQHGWHLYPWVLTCCVCCAVGLAPLPAAEPATPPVRRLRYLQAALCTALALVALLRFSDEAGHLAHDYWTGQRDRVYRRVASALRERAQSGNAFASVEVGTIGYYSDLPAFDLGGLVTPPQTPMAGRGVRFLIVDKLYPNLRPPIAPSLVVREGDFIAELYELPQR